MLNKNAPTLLDVAKRAGVSKAASAAVLSGARSTVRISEATRLRIQEAAAELRYHPNAAARGLRRAKLETIGVSIHSLGRLAVSNPYGNQVLQGIVQAAHDAKYNATLVHKPWDDSSRSIEGFRSDLVDGMVVVAPDEDNGMIADLASRGIPVVAVSAVGEICGVPSVDVDNVRGTRLIMDHLLGLGHTRIAMVVRGFPRQDSIVRRNTFLAAMSEAGLSVPPEYIQMDDTPSDPIYNARDLVVPPMDSPRRFEFYEPSRLLLTLPARPTAIFAADDRIARDVLLAARDLNISVPDQLSVVGFDDLPDAARFDPPLTTARQPLVEMGAAATEILIGILSGEEAVTKTKWFEPELIIRNSTARPDET